MSRPGEFVPTKFIWLLDDVEIVGRVHAIGVSDGEPFGDDFDILPDPNYQHLIRYFRGNAPLPWSASSEPAVMHLETYPYDQWNPPGINRLDPWPLSKKPGTEPFMLRFPGEQQPSRPLAVGDRVRVRGRWVIDHHPEYCETPTKLAQPEPNRCTWSVGLSPFGPLPNKIGNTHTELHPFDWTKIYAAEPPQWSSGESCTLSLAVPLYEQQYIGDGKFLANDLCGINDRIFVVERGDFTNYHTNVGARIALKPPDPPALPATTYRRLGWRETVMKIGTNLSLDGVRTISVSPDHLDVQATLLGHGQPHIDDPARNRWVFQARYDVWWILAGNEISCITRGPATGFPRPTPGPIIGLGGVLADGTNWWMRTEQAIAALRDGHRFFISAGGLSGRTVDVVVAGTGDRAFLTTDPPPSDRFNAFNALPACMNPPILT